MDWLEQTRAAVVAEHDRIEALGRSGRGSMSDAQRVVALENVLDWLDVYEETQDTPPLVVVK